MKKTWTGENYVSLYISLPSLHVSQNTYSSLCGDYRILGSGIGDSYLYPTLYRGIKQGTILGVDGNGRTLQTIWRYCLFLVVSALCHSLP